MWRMERYFLVGWTNLSQAIMFQVPRKNTNSKMVDSVLLLLDLFDDSEVEYDKILSIHDDFIFSV